MMCELRIVRMYEYHSEWTVFYKMKTTRQLLTGGGGARYFSQL